jgi:hypothetical protein
MKYQLPTVNYSALKNQREAAKGGFGDRLSFIKVEPQQQIFFYILPPWNDRGFIAKEVWECYNLPLLPGKKRSVHTSWQTHEAVEPGISAQDPIVKVLKEMKELVGDKENRLLPGRKFQLNIILRGRGKIDSAGQIIPSTYEQMTPPKVCVLALTPPAFTTLSNMLISAGESSEGRADNPLASICYCLTREEKVPPGGGKAKTSYIIGVEGAMIAGRGVVPTRHNLEQELGEKFVEATFTAITDLDAAYPLPTENQRVEAQHWASHIKQEMTARLSGKVARTTTGAIQVQSQSGPPVAPELPEEEPTAPSSVELPKEPFFDTLPTAPAVPTASTSVIVPGLGEVTSKDVVTRDLGLMDAPRKDGDIPMCFGHFDKVSGSPNSRWCSTCTFKLPCKAKSGMAKKA